VEEIGIDKFKELIEEKGVALGKAVEVEYPDEWERRDLLGVHDQKQAGMKWIGVHVPVGRLTADDFYDMADV